MPRPASAKALDLRQSLAAAFAVNERMNQMVLEQLHPAAWRSKPPGKRVRSIADIFAHVHNIRRKWVRLSAPGMKLPAPLQHTRCTPQQARKALAESARCCLQMIAGSLTGSGQTKKQFLRDGWARPWPAGVAMVAYMISHEAHHRGQVCMLAHQLGHPLTDGYKIWLWEKLYSECGFDGPR